MYLLPFWQRFPYITSVRDPTGGPLERTSPSCVQHTRTIEITHNKSHSAFQQYSLSPPPQRTFPERSFQRLVDCPDETKLHFASYFGRNIVFDVFSVCPRKNDFANLCPVGTKDFHPNAANRRDAPAKRNLPTR